MNAITTRPLADFIREVGLTMTSEQTDSNPHMEDSGNMDHWKCLLRCGRSRMTIHFSKGVGHHGSEPEVDEVIDCLASDSAGVENASTFENWCDEYGYDHDSRKAEKTYKVCLDQAAKLKKFLGESAFETLLWNIDRL